MMAKRKNCRFYKGGVGNARRADVHNRIFLVMAQNVPEDDPTELPKMTQHRPKMGRHRPQMGST